LAHACDRASPTSSSDTHGSRWFAGGGTEANQVRGGDASGRMKWLALDSVGKIQDTRDLVSAS